jgi:hypothetical protein
MHFIRKLRNCFKREKYSGLQGISSTETSSQFIEFEETSGNLSDFQTISKTLLNFKKIIEQHIVVELPA